MHEIHKKKDAPSGALMTLLIAVLIVNQFIIGSVAVAMGKPSTMRTLMTIGTPAAQAQMMIMMPVLNDDGVTTTLREMPTVTEVTGFAGSGDDVADAMAVMMGTGSPFYAPDGVALDDAVGALSAWGRYDSMEVPESLMDRYQRLIMVFACNFCCGSPNNVAVVGRCGCAHAKAARGFFRYMLNNYGDQYTDDQLVGEAYRWQAIWYPAGVVEDYLLATGRGDVIGHKPHGGVGADGMHGMMSE